MEGAQGATRATRSRYTAIKLPNPGESATSGPPRRRRARARGAARDNVFVPLRGDPATGSGARAAPRSGARPTRPCTTTPDAHGRPADGLRRGQERRALPAGHFTYSERVPTQPIPLMGFLYEDKRGYCQQFSGAMALMLRMAGIPARVAAGFSPGSYNKDTGEYRVRDLDAHSWVEVWFTGIGWVPFDPTPARSPAQSQSSALATSAAAPTRARCATRQGVAASERATDSARRLGSDGGNGWLVPLLLLLVVAPLAARRAPARARVRRLRSLAPDELAEVQLSELRRALAAARLGPAGVHHAAGARAAARPLRRARRRRPMPGPARQPLRPARAGGARPGPAPGGAPGAHARERLRPAARPGGDPAGRATVRRTHLSKPKVGALNLTA